VIEAHLINGEFDRSKVFARQTASGGIDNSRAKVERSGCAAIKLQGPARQRCFTFARDFVK
jgi:hypothetical protein